MNFSSHSLICSRLASSGASVPEWRPNFLTSEMSVALISVTIVNLIVSPVTIFLNVLWLVGCVLWLVQSELVYRLTGSPASEFCIIPHATRGLTRAFGVISLHHLASISMERYIAIKIPFKYRDIITKRRLIVCDILALSLVLTASFFRYKVVFFGYFLLRFAMFLSIFILIFCRIASYYEARKRIGNITNLSARAKFLK